MQTKWDARGRFFLHLVARWPFSVGQIYWGNLLAASFSVGQIYWGKETNNNGIYDIDLF